MAKSSESKIKPGTDSEHEVFSEKWWASQPQKIEDEGKTTNAQDETKESVRKERKLTTEGKMNRLPKVF